MTYEPALAPGLRQQNRGCSSTIDPASLAPDEALDPRLVPYGGQTGRSRPRQLLKPHSTVPARPALTRPTAKAWPICAPGCPTWRRWRRPKRRSIPTAAWKYKPHFSKPKRASAFDQGRYVETIMALDERSRIAPERTGLMVMRGYAYLKLKTVQRRGTGFSRRRWHRESRCPEGLNDVKAARDSRSSSRYVTAAAEHACSTFLFFHVRLCRKRAAELHHVLTHGEWSNDPAGLGRFDRVAWRVDLTAASASASSHNARPEYPARS